MSPSASTTSVARLTLAAASSLGLAASGCREAPRVEDQAAPAVVEDDVDLEAEAQRRAEAHAKALKNALATTPAVFDQADPVAASRLQRRPLAPPSFGTPERRALAATLEGPASMLREIDERVLTNMQVVMLRVIRFGLERENERVNLADPAWRDPTIAWARLDDFTDELEFRLAIGDEAAGLEALKALPASLEPLSTWVSGTSPAIAAEAARRARALLDRWAALRGAADPSNSAAAAEWAEWIDASLVAGESVHTRYLALPEQLASAPSKTWRSDSLSPHPSRALYVLPDVLGGVHLRHRWLREERLDDHSANIFQNSEALIQRYAALRSKHGADGDPASETGEAAVVDPGRCERLWAPIVAFAQGSTDLVHTPLSCAAIARMFGERTVDDGALSMALIDWGVSEPTARQAQAQHASAIGLLSSVHARRAHRLLHGVSVAIALGDAPAVRATIDRAADAVCHGAVAMWLHGEAGEEEKLPEWTGARCPKRTPDEWRALALGDPRGGITGALMSRTQGGPAEMVPAMIYPWAPGGVQRLLATPKGEHPDGARQRPIPPKVTAKIEEIRPGQPLPPSANVQPGTGTAAPTP